MKIQFLLLFSCLWINGYTQSNYIYWTETTVLQWSDFKGDHYAINTPEFARSIPSVSRLGVTTDLGLLGDSLTFTSRSYFDKDRSSVRWDFASNDLFLAHERVHFQIREVYCRKIKKAIIENGSFSRKTAKKDISTLVKQIEKLHNNEQLAFDGVSKLSMSRAIKKYEEKASIQLKELSAFKSPSVKVLLVD